MKFLKLSTFTCLFILVFGFVSCKKNEAPVGAAPPSTEVSTKEAPPATTPIDENTLLKPLEHPLQVVRGERDGKINQLVGNIIERAHYLQHPYDKEMSQRQLKGYLEALDYNHLIFLQSDIDEFTTKYGNELDQYASNHDASPAFEMFQRYLQRLEERKRLVDQLLKEKFDFTTNEHFNPNRDKAPFPKTEAEAQDLWRKRIKLELLQGRLNKEKPEDTVKKVGHRYDNLLKQVYEYDEDEVLQTYLNALAHSYDPHTDYFTPDEAENFDINAIKLTLSGIGAVLRSEDGYAKIEKLVSGGPADLDGRLKPNDRIAAVAQGTDKPVDVVDMKLTKVVDLIRGKKGTSVRLLVVPAGVADTSVRKEVILKRDDIKLTEQFAKAEIFEHPNALGQLEKVGVIVLPEFYEKTVDDVAELIERLKQENVVGMVLDLRKNGGGLLDQAIDLTGLFIKGGPVVQVKNAQGQIQVLSTDKKNLYDGPLIVLVSKLSASASEIVAGALQDYGRALIVGDQSTHGKGTVQTLLPLDRWMGLGFSGDPGKLKITVQKFYRIAGGSTQKKGVIPEITLPSLLDYYEIGERTLPNCLPYDEVDKADYDVFNKVTPYLQQLSSDSSQRVTKSQDFNYVREDIDLLKKKLADKSVSLNLDERLKEKSDLLSREEMRKSERAKRVKSQEKVYELTIDMAEKKLPFAEAKPPKPKIESASSSDDEETFEDTETTSIADDPQLYETLSIMIDYANLFTTKGTLTTQYDNGIQRPERKAD